MKPILYESRETDFNHNGLGKMNETLSAIVTEVANGEFELEVVYPIGGRLYKHIQDHMLIKVKPNSVDDPHVFRIYEHTIDTVGQTVTIYAHTKSNDLGQNLVKDVVISSLTPQEAMNRMKMNLVEPTDYSFVSDITTRSSTEWKNRNPLNCIAGEEGSLIHYWGGEIKRDNRTIYLYRRRGRDNVAIIRDGKNINGLSLEYSTKGMVTKIIPYRTYTPEDSDDEVVEYGTPVESQYIGNYPLVYVRAIDYSNDDDVTSLQTMNTKASRYFTENNGVDKPSVNVSMGLVELSDSSEYEKFKDFENVELFDTVTVYSKQYDIHIEAKITTVEYDSLAGKNISLEMGSYRTGLIESTERTYMELIGEKEAKLIQTIQVAANGKNRVFRGVTEPVTGMVKNDIWYQPVGAGETMMYVFDGAYWQLNKVSAGLLGGTLDAENGDVNLINVNVANIVGETSNFVKSWWNNAAGGGVDIDGDGIVTQSGELLTRISAGQVTNQSGTKSGKVDALGMEISDSDNGQTTKLFADGLEFGWYSIIRQITQTSEGLQIKPITGSGFRLNSALNLTAGPGADKVAYLQLDVPGALSSARVQLANKTMSVRHPNDGELIISDYNFDGSKGLTRSGTFRTNPVDGAYLEMVGKEIKTAREGNNNIFLTPSGNGGVRIGSPTSSELYPITALSFVEGSNRDSKTNIKPFEEKALDIVNDLVVTEYNLKVELERGINQRKIGFIAEDSPSISAKQSGSDKLGVDHYKMTAIAIKAIQELDKENTILKQELSDLKNVLKEKGLI